MLLYRGHDTARTRRPGRRAWLLPGRAPFLLASLACATFLALDGIVLRGQTQPRPPSDVRILSNLPQAPPPGSGPLGGWPMAGANVQRTSSSPADISTVAGVAWYRPIEAFISGTTQLITAEGRVYVATARGLVVPVSYTHLTLPTILLV